MDPGKLDLARRLFVYDFKPFGQICMDLDISMFDIMQAAEEEGWEKQREEHKQKRASESGDSLAQHRYMSDKNLRYMDVLLTKQADQNLSPQERRQLMYQMETALAAAEALSKSVEIDRKIHGIRNSAPSVSKDVEEVQGVRYFVGLPPPVEQPTENT